MKTVLVLFMILFVSHQGKSFKEKQLEQKRVSKAYKEKYEDFISLLKEKSIAIGKLEIFLRVYKAEGLLELWGKEKTATEFRKNCGV